MKITLTEKQIRQLMPFHDRVQSAAQTGYPGMLVAQIRWDHKMGKWWMEPGFLPYEHAKQINEKGETSIAAEALSEDEEREIQALRRAG